MKKILGKEKKKEGLQIEAIKDKIELSDVQIQVDPCKGLGWGRYDCLIDCKDYSPKGSPAY